MNSFTSGLICRFHNKGVYVQLALQKMVTKKVTAELSKHINIIVRWLVCPLKKVL